MTVARPMALPSGVGLHRNTARPMMMTTENEYIVYGYHLMNASVRSRSLWTKAAGSSA